MLRGRGVKSFGDARVDVGTKGAVASEGRFAGVLGGARRCMPAGDGPRGLEPEERDGPRSDAVEEEVVDRADMCGVCRPSKNLKCGKLEATSKR